MTEASNMTQPHELLPWPPGLARLALVLLLCLCAGQAQAQAQAARGGDDMAGRIGNVERLIERSSGASRVRSSQVAAALEKQAEARAQLEAARQAHAAGDPGRTRDLLDQASRTMFEAVRLTGPPESLQDKARDDFDNQARSIEALAEALARIGKEKPSAGAAQGLAGEVTGMLARARQLNTGGSTEQARALLSEAYDKAKRGIEELRGGETLVRSLHFNSKEEEYHYELDRNDTHHMLLEVLAKEGGNPMAAMTDSFVAKARGLREQAEREAAQGQHDLAIKSLELSTKELIRAIRSTGVYIPG
jgi:hypothetical protein